MATLYPFEEPYNSFYLAVGGENRLHVEQHGNPEGYPVLVCHGGPGGGLNRAAKLFFHPDRYRIILFSQRGSGLSTPFRLEDNNTWELVEDIRTIQRHLGLASSLLCGESWGATLALVFAIHYPERVDGLLLGAAFLATQGDLDWLYGPDGGGAQSYPTQYNSFAGEHKNAHEVIDYYHRAMQESDPEGQLALATRWLVWEQTLSGHNFSPDFALHDDEVQRRMARLMLHYFAHQCFLQDGYIAAHYKALSRIPGWFVHHRQDLICRLAPVENLACSMRARLDVLEGVGHCGLDEVYCRAMRRAADLMYVRLARKQCKVLSNELNGQR